MNKKELTEQEIRTHFITPAIQAAGWHGLQMREEYYFTDGRFHIQQHGKSRRGDRAYADYLLIYKNIPLAIVEAKDNNHTLGSGIQQALRYADALDAVSSHSSNCDRFLDMMNGVGDFVERGLALSQFPSPEELWQRYTQQKQISSDQEAGIPLPPLAEQKRMVAHVNTRLRLCDDLAAHLHQAQATQSALHDAVLTI